MQQSRQYRFKNRRHTACTECYRRKQKCNRQHPCNVCQSRGASAKCSYQHTVRDSTHNDIVVKSSPHSTDTSQPPEDLALNVGYADPAAAEGRPTALADMLTHSSQLLGSNIRTNSGLQALRSLSSSKRTRLGELLSQVPEAFLVQALVQVFFSEANWYFTVLDQYYFEEVQRDWYRFSGDMEQCSINRETVYFPALLFQVLALALSFVPEKSTCALLVSQISDDFDSLSQQYSDAGEAILVLLGRRQPSITSVQADVVRCAWLKNSGQGSEAWYSLGNALRQAQDIGLHLEPVMVRHTGEVLTPELLQTLWHNEHKRRLWATLFAWEGHMALQLGRPRMVNVSDCTISAPLDCDLPREPSKTLFRAFTCGDRPSLYRVALLKYQIAQWIHDAMSRGAFNRDFNDLSAIGVLHKHVTDLLANLPSTLQSVAPDTSWDLQIPELRKHRLNAAIIVDAVLLALHRPHAAKYRKSLDEAINAAIRLLNYSQKLFEATEPHHHRTYTLIFYTIDAGISLATLLARFPRDSIDRRSEAIEALTLSVSRLSVLRQRNVAAIAGESVLNKFLEILQPSSPQHSLTTVNGSTHAAGPQQQWIPAQSYGDEVNDVLNEGQPDRLTDENRFWEEVLATDFTSNWLQQFDLGLGGNLDMTEDGFMWDTLRRW